MQLGMIGLGRMGANMTTRLIRGGHQVVAYDRDAGRGAALAGDGATGATSLRTWSRSCRAARGVDHGAGRRRRPIRRSPSCWRCCSPAT